MKRSRFLLLGAVLCSCATTQSRFVPLGAEYPPLPETAPVELLSAAPTDRKFVKVARIDVHLEQSHFQKPSLGDAAPEIMRQARLAGAQAVIDLQEVRRSIGETGVYHVTATAIRFTDGQP